MQGTKRPEFDPWIWKIPWSRKWQPTPVFLPGKFHGQKRLVRYSPWGRKELDMTEHAYMLLLLLLSHFSCVLLFAAPWSVANQASLSMGFSRQEYWSGLPFPTPGDLPNPEIKVASLSSPALAGRFFTTSLPGKPLLLYRAGYIIICDESDCLDSDSQLIRDPGQSA